MYCDIQVTRPALSRHECRSTNSAATSLAFKIWSKEPAIPYDERLLARAIANAMPSNGWRLMNLGRRRGHAFFIRIAITRLPRPPTNRIFPPFCNLFHPPPVILSEKLASTTSSPPFIRAGNDKNETRSLALVYPNQKIAATLRSILC